MSYSPQNIQRVNLGFVEVKLFVSPSKYKYTVSQLLYLVPFKMTVTF